MFDTIANMFGPNAIIIIVIVIVLLFGAQRIPEMMRNMGSGMKEFKKGLSEDDVDKSEKTEKSDKDDVKKV
jgi:sec-independent protein translocase protein TatA